LVTLNCILNRITGVTSGCWWLVVVNAIPTSDICQINQQNISGCSVINNRIKKFSQLYCQLKQSFLITRYFVKLLLFIKKKKQLSFITFVRTIPIQSDQKENESDQALQIIGHVVAKSFNAWAYTICGLNRCFSTPTSTLN
jgi:hypothetical protein